MFTSTERRSVQKASPEPIIITRGDTASRTTSSLRARLPRLDTFTFLPDKLMDCRMTRIRQNFSREKPVIRERQSTKASRSQVWPVQRTQPVPAISADVRHRFAPAPPLGIGMAHGLVG